MPDQIPECINALEKITSITFQNKKKWCWDLNIFDTKNFSIHMPISHVLTQSQLNYFTYHCTCHNMRGIGKHFFSFLSHDKIELLSLNFRAILIKWGLRSK